MVAMNDAHGICLTCHLVFHLLLFMLFQQCVNANMLYLNLASYMLFFELGYES